MEAKKLIATLHPLERKVLPALKHTKHFKALIQKTDLQEVEVMRALQWLQNKKLVRINQKLQEIIKLDTNGLQYKKHGLPEKSFLGQIIKRPLSLDEIGKKSKLGKQELSISLGILKSKEAIDVKKEKGTVVVSITDSGKHLFEKKLPQEEFLQKSFPIVASDLKSEEKSIFESLKKRKNIVKTSIHKDISAELTDSGKKILEAGIAEKDIIDRLTPEILKSGEWKQKELRKYDVTINVPKISGGKLHFVMQAIQYIKKIWLDLGFREITGSYVQTSFWDLDALFVPQDHPARDEQDTFFLKDPAKGKLPTEIAKKVRAAHENGWTTGSKGWQYKWSSEEAKKLLMITHDTYLSARTLASTKEEDLPIKTFQISRVFRNEAISWKHLFEFHQVGGIVADPNANFTHLKGYLRQFFRKMGFPDVRIRPAHFPYTEPSAEIDVWHPQKKQWIELGGSGMFRPELVKPLLGIECPVLAWGIGLERTIMEYYGFTDIRDIYRNDIKQLREAKLWMKIRE